MAEIPLPGRDSVGAQAEMFRRAATEEGLTIAVLAKRAPLPVSTLKGWANGTAMPAWAIGALGEAGVPDHLLSLVLEPFAKHVGTDEDGEGDLDTAGLDAGEVQHAVARARSPNSPGGVQIVPQEKALIIPLVRRCVASGRRAVG